MHVPAFFKGVVAVSKELSLDEKQLHDDLKRFLQAFNTRQEVAKHLNTGQSIHYHMHKLKWALQEELSSLEEGEVLEKEIIYDLKFLSKEEYIKQIDDFCRELTQIKDHDNMVRGILSEIHDIVKAEAAKVHRISKGNVNHDSHVESLKDLFMIEKHLVEKLGNLEDFRELFRGMYIGEFKEQQLEGIRKRFADGMYKRMTSVLLGEDGQAYATDGHYISELTAGIFNKLQAEVMHAVHSGKIGHHPHVDYEFVNSDLFEKFVRMEIDMDKAKGKIVPSPRTIATFVQIFRSLFNSELSAVYHQNKQEAQT